MSAKLDRIGWREAMKTHRQERQSHVSRVEVRSLKRPSQPTPMASKQWTERVRLSRSVPGGGRQRSLTKPSQVKTQRKTGGMLRSSIPKKRKEISEAQRQALPKSGGQTVKKGLNASRWAYDHRRSTAEKRMRVQPKESSPKQGINAEKWHYDHRKAEARKQAGLARPTTHVSAEKKQTQTEAQKRQIPQRPQRPQIPAAKPLPKAPVQRRAK